MCQKPSYSAGVRPGGVVSCSADRPPTDESPSSSRVTQPTSITTDCATPPGAKNWAESAACLRGKKFVVGGYLRHIRQDHSSQAAEDCVDGSDEDEADRRHHLVDSEHYMRCSVDTISRLAAVGTEKTRSASLVPMVAPEKTETESLERT